MWLTACIACFLILEGGSLDFRLEPISESPGLYYEHVGEARLSTSEWKILSYVNLAQVNTNFDVVKRYAKFTVDFCRAHERSDWANLTECRTTITQVDRKIAKLELIKGTLMDLTKWDSSSLRFRRRLFGFIGTISHTLFGTLDEEDGKFYTDKISQLEQEQASFLRLSKEQVVLVKTTLRTVNRTLHDVAYNERILEKGLLDIKKHIVVEEGNLNMQLGYTSMLMALNDHALQLDRAIEELQDQYSMLIDAVIHAQKGILQPQLISPRKILQIMKDNQAHFPLDQSLPIPLSSEYAPQLLQLIDLDVFVQGTYFVYVITLPLTSQLSYNMYHIHIFPSKINGTASKFIFVQPEKEIILVDKTKQYYTRLSLSELARCKVPTPALYVCNQHSPVQLMHSGTECEARLLQYITRIPPTCSQRITELTSTLWTQLQGNTWLYVAPQPEHFTILCPGQEPTDLIINGLGKVIFLKLCSGYGNSVVIQAHGITKVNNTDKDIIPPIHLEYDCCETIGSRQALNELHLDTPLRSVLTSENELRLSSHKVSEVETMINEQQWKLEHSRRTESLSFFSIIGLCTSVLLICILLCLCCCQCCKCWPYFKSWWGRQGSCHTILFKPKIITKIHNSNENLPMPSSYATLRQVSGTADETELVTIVAPDTPKFRRGPNTVTATDRR